MEVILLSKKGYWRGLWKCKRCGKRLDTFKVICDDCVIEIFTKEVPELGVNGAARKYGVAHTTLRRRAKILFESGRFKRDLEP